MELLKVKMVDESVFKMPNEMWQKAFDLKYGEDKEQAIKIFIEITDKHWKAKTEPTKFGWGDSWDTEFTNQAKLGEKVMYIYIRATLMGLVLEEMAKKDDSKPARVVTITEDGGLKDAVTGEKVEI